MTAGPAPVPAAGHGRTPRVLAVLLAALLLLFSAITIGQSAVARQITLGSFNTGAGLMLTLRVIAAVGLVVAWHQPGNPIGWLLLGALAWQIASWRRSSGERRQQLKWLMSGAAVCGVFAVASFGSNASLWEILIIGIIALPVSIGIGILKYRLYDIDRIISRTLAYALVTGLLVGVYAGLVLLATEVLRFSSPVAVAASTLAAAALFNPVRRRVQRMVDRRFNRACYDADLTVAAFAARLKDAVDLDAVHDDLAGVVTRTLEPAHVSIWISRPG